MGYNRNKNRIREMKTAESSALEDILTDEKKTKEMQKQIKEREFFR